MTRLKITAGGFDFMAEAHPDAPLTVAALAKLLPYRQKLIHVRWSGEGCWVPLGEFKLENDGTPVGFENHTGPRRKLGPLARVPSHVLRRGYSVNS